MNEIRLIRNQLAAERQHAMAVVSAWAGALTQAGPHAAPGGSVLEAFGQACVEYLGGVLARFDARDERLAELYARLPADDPARGAVNEALAGRGRGCEALERLESVLARHPGPARAGGPSGDCQELVH
ncbi:MAG: hypothetical protein ACRETH_05670, partial [Steroidobacteraceae bacterium]